MPRSSSDDLNEQRFERKFAFGRTRKKLEYHALSTFYFYCVFKQMYIEAGYRRNVSREKRYGSLLPNRKKRKLLQRDVLVNNKEVTNGKKKKNE